MRRSIRNKGKAFGIKAIRRTALVGLVLLSVVSVSRGWDPTLALAVAGTWSATGSMTTPRSQQTATLLPSGKVLVVGGSNNLGSTEASAELYDPATGTWSVTGSMATPRSAHTATLLLSGKVLVAGGYNGVNNSLLAGAELYDPVAGTWSLAGSMNSARFAHTATLLRSGKVLVAGGSHLYGGSILASAELYDPVTGTWSTTGGMNSARFTHTATLLPSGKVLVAGGSNSHSGSSLASAELYDPVVGTWSVTGSMATPRAEHTATLLPSGKVLVAGRRAGSFVTESAELYDPVAGTWSATGGMTTTSTRFRHTATLLPSGKVLVVGGCCSTGFGTLFSSAELYDPVAGTWSTTGGMTTERYEHAATLLPSGKVLVAGGFNGNSLALVSAEVYDPAGVPSRCALTHSGIDTSGHTFIDIAVQDPNSGLGLVKVTESNNASVVVPTFAVGTTSPQIVVATKTDQTMTAQVALQVTNVAGQVTNCDPILTVVGRDGPHGAPRVETFHHVAQGESQVTILNGTPGLTRLRLVVNGHAFEITGLTDGETRLVDVSTAMRRGDNTLTLIAQGKTDRTASILIADK